MQHPLFQGSRVVCTLSGESTRQTSFDLRCNNPSIKIYILVALALLEQPERKSLAATILNHLHGLDVEWFLMENASQMKREKKYAKADIYYQAMALMHPIAAIYLEWADMYLLHDQKECTKILKKAKEKAFLPHNIELINRSAALTTMIHSDVCQMNESQGLKYVTTLIEMLQNNIDKLGSSLTNYVLKQIGFF